MIVPDASVVVTALVDDGGAGALAREVLDADHDWHAPHLIDIEVVSALRGHVLGGHLSAAWAQDALEDFTDLAPVRYPHHALLPRVWDLHDNVTSYDACYLALAELLDAVLVTTDARLASVPGLRCDVRVVVP